MSASDEDLANRLRQLAETLHETAADNDRRMAADALLQEADALLSVGERRLRWHEVDEVMSGRRARTRDLSPWSGTLNPTARVRIEQGERAGQPCMVGRVRLAFVRARFAAPMEGHGSLLMNSGRWAGPVGDSWRGHRSTDDPLPRHYPDRYRPRLSELGGAGSWHSARHAGRVPARGIDRR